MDLFRLLQIILNRSVPKEEAKEAAIQYCKEHKTEKSVIMTVAGATNSQIDYNSFERGNGDMCTLFEELAKESEEKGKALGKAEGIIKILKKYENSDIEIRKELMKELNISMQKAQEYLDIFSKQ